MSRFLKTIDSINAGVGSIFRFLLIPMMVIATFEVVMRYVFNRPTSWAWEINGQLLAFMIILAGGFALLNRSHVTVDVVYARFSVRGKAMADLFTSLFFFLLVLIFIWKSSEVGWTSFLQREVAPTVIRSPIYITKMAIPVGAFLLLLQGVAKFIRDLATVMGKGDSQ